MNATASLTLSSLAVGSRTITVHYGGDLYDYASDSAPLTQTVNLLTSTATLSTSTLPLGTRSITAVYSGDYRHAPSTSQVVFQGVNASVPMFYAPTPNGGGGWTAGGITGTYFAHSDFTGTSFSRNDVRVDFPDTTVMPGGSLPTEPKFGEVGSTNFSASWSGVLIPKYTQSYTLKVRGLDQMQVIIDGSLIATSTGQWVAVPFNFTAGQQYSVQVTLIKGGSGPWAAQFHWLSNGPELFREEAIGPVTPIGINGYDKNNAANGCLIGGYSTGIETGVQGPALDSSGWPTGDFGLARMGDIGAGTGPYSFPSPHGCDTSTGIWTITFNGSAECYTNGQGNFLLGHNDGSRVPMTINGTVYYKYGNTLYLTNQLYDAAGTGYDITNNKTTALFYLDPNGVNQYNNLGFRNTDRSGNGTPAKGGVPAHNGITNVKLMKPTTPGALTSYPVGTTFLPPYLACHSPYTALRLADSAYEIDFPSAYTTPYSDWAKRPRPTFNYQASRTADWTADSPAWEHRILLANQTGKDLYLCISQSASGGSPASDADYQNSYIYKLASLLKNGAVTDGVAYPGLLPHLRVYLEWGNENWNYTLNGPYGSRGDITHDVGLAKSHNTATYQQFIAMGGRVWLDGSGNVTNADDTLWSCLRAKNVSDIFRAVYGDSALPGSAQGLNPDPVVRPIFEWQYGDGWNGEGYFASTAFDKIQSYFGMQVNTIFWGGGAAWYSDNNTAGADANAVFSNISLATCNPPGTGSTNTIFSDCNTLVQYGLRHIGYEGGFDFGDGGNHCTNGQQQAHNDVRVKPYVRQVVDQYFSSGGCLPVAMLLTGGNYGYALEWAIIDGVWSVPPFATAPPKLQAYIDAQGQLPAALTSGLVIPSTSFANPYGYGNGQTTSQKFRVVTSGYYQAGFVVSTSNTYARGTINLTIDGLTVGTLVTQNANGGQSLWVPIWLSAGLHGAKLSFSNEVPSGTQIAISNWGVKV